MLACSRCGKTLPKANFTSKQLKAKASARFCIACTKGTGTLHACFSQAASGPAAERPSQVVTEKTVATTPEKQDVVVQIERLSTGGTRYEAHYERPGSGPMSDAQRKAKTRARTSLFPDRVAAERAENTGRMAALRAADREQAAEILAAQSGTESEPDCDRYACPKCGDLCYETEFYCWECGFQLKELCVGGCRLGLDVSVQGEIAEAGSRSLIIDFFGNGSAAARQVTQIMRDAGLSCRTLFSSEQLDDACGYNCAKWACMLHALGETFHTFTSRSRRE